MKVINIENDLITVSFPKAEYGFLISAIGQTLESLEEWEFQTITALYREEAEALQNVMNQSYDLITK